MSLLTAEIAANPTIAAVVDLDSSLLFQLAVFLLFFYLFNKILIQPMLNVFEQRHSLTDGARDKAKQAVTDAEAKIKEYEEKIAEARRQALEEGKAIRAEAAEKERELLEARKAETQATVDKGLAELQKSHQAATAQLESAANETATRIVTQIIGGAA